MDLVLIILLGCVGMALPIVIICLVIKGNKNKSNVNNDIKDNKIIDNKKKDKPIRLKNIKHISGISRLTEDEDCGICVQNDSFNIISKIGNFNIPLDRIVNAGVLSKKEVEEKNKSVIGRAFVGSMVGLGFLGALSGIGTKVKNKNNYFLIINYKDKDSEEIKSIMFGLGDFASAGQLGYQFVAKLSKRLNNEKVDIEL